MLPLFYFKQSLFSMTNLIKSLIKTAIQISMAAEQIMILILNYFFHKLDGYVPSATCLSTLTFTSGASSL